MLTDETYLGDAVYASFDGYRIWLRTGDGGNQRIALEPAVLWALDSWRAALRRKYAVTEAERPAASPADE